VRSLACPPHKLGLIGKVDRPPAKVLLKITVNADRNNGPDRFPRHSQHKEQTQGFHVRHSFSLSLLFVLI